MFEIYYSYWRLSLVIMTIGLVGCATKAPEPNVIIKTEYKHVLVPDAFLNDCFISKPPAKDVYIASGEKAKEGMLTDYSMSLLKDLKNCNAQLSKARSFQTQIEEEIKGK